MPVIGAEHAPNLIAALKQQNIEIKDAPADPERAVREMDADLVLRIPAEFADSWRKGEPAQVELIYDASQRDAQGSVEAPARRARKLFAAHRRAASARARLVARRDRPVVVADRDQSTAQTRSGTLFAMLPYFFILGAFIGGMALAIDTTAGERERQSLEPLFVNPVSRSQHPDRQAAATSAFALTSVLLGIVAFSLVGRLLPTEKLGMSLEIGFAFRADDDARDAAARRS